MFCKQVFSTLNAFLLPVQIIFSLKYTFIFIYSGRDLTDDYFEFYVFGVLYSDTLVNTQHHVSRLA